MTDNDIAIPDDDQLALLPPAQPRQTNAVAMLSQHAQAMHTAYQLAERLCQTELVPARYRRKPEDATAAILYGAELGLNPIQSLQNVFSVNGSPAIYARTMAALLKARGYRFRTPEKTYDAVEIHGWEPGRDPDTTAPDEKSRWTLEDARKAGYTSNKKYETDPRAMLYAKALAEVCRHLAPDILLGISYAVEEFETPPLVRVAAAPITVEEILTPTEDDPVGAGDAPDSDTNPPGVPAPTLDPDPITPAQLRKLSILLRENGFDDRDSRHGFVSAAIGREISSAKDLTKDEASHVIDTLESNPE